MEISGKDLNSAQTSILGLFLYSTHVILLSIPESKGL